MASLLKCSFVFLGLFILSTGLQAQVKISEVLFDPTGTNTGKQWVELVNDSDAQVDVGGYWLRYAPADYRIPNETTIEAGETLLIHLNRSGSPSTSELFTGIGGQRNLELTDSLSLFETNLFNDSSKLVDFVQWGNPEIQGDHEESLALEAGLWAEGERVSIEALRPGSSLLRMTSEVGASAWCLTGSPSPGENVTECTIPRVISALMFNEYGPSSSSEGMTVELVLESDVQEIIGGYSLSYDGGIFTFPEGQVALPGQLFQIHFGQSGVDTETEFFLGEETAGPSLDSEGEFTIFGSDQIDQASWLVSYIAWGNGGQATEALAAEAGAWEAGDFISTSGRLEEGSIAVVEDLRSEFGSQAWQVDNTPSIGEVNSAVPYTEIVINEVLILPNGAGLQAIEVFNRGDNDQDLTDYSICSQITTEGEEIPCFDFPENFVIEADSYVVIWLDGNPGVVGDNIFLNDFVNLNPNQGGLSLLKGHNSDLIGNYVDFVQWGETGALGWTQAVRAGIWPEEGLVPVGSPNPGTSVAYLGTGRGPERYNLDRTPTLGISNESGSEAVPFNRGDCTGDGIHDISDPIFILAYQFIGAEAPSCFDSCDVNDDAALDITDGIASLGFLFLGLAPPPEPSACGLDPTPDELTCDVYEPCQS